MKKKNNDDSKMFHFSFVLANVSDFEIIKQIRNFKDLGYDSQSDLLRDSISRFFENGSDSNNLKEAIEQAKLELLKNKNSDHSLIKRKLDAETRISEYHADSLDTIGSKPSTLAKKAMEHHINGTTPIDENSIRCPDCANWRSNSKHGIEWQIDAVTKHVRNFHNRDFTESEANELAELIK